MNKLNKRKSAFTLIELLVVVAIIGILAAVGVPAYQGYQENAKNQSNENQFKTVASYVQNEVAKVNMGGSSTLITAVSAAGVMTVDTSILTTYKNPYTNATINFATEVVAGDCGVGALDALGNVSITGSGTNTLTVKGCSLNSNGTDGDLKSITIKP